MLKFTILEYIQLIYSCYDLYYYMLVIYSCDNLHCYIVVIYSVNIASALVAPYEGNPLAIGGFPSQRASDAEL